MNDVNALRTHLFDTIKGLRDGTINIETAQAITGTAQAIINSAKVEVEYVKAGGKVNSGFIPLADPGHALPPGTKKTPTGTLTTKPGVITHRLDG